MKIGVLVVGVLGLLGSSAVARAQNVPPARTGFQMDVRTGYSIPTGSASKGDKLSNTFSGQVPVIVDIGGKLIPELFLGGYLGLGFGSEGSDGTAACAANGVSCSAVGLHVGALVQYHILPAELANPWVGYGIGIESTGVNVNGGAGGDRSYSLTGVEFARLMLGVDFRVSDVFGVGPFVDYTLGQYSRGKFTTPAGDVSGDIEDKGTHGWLTLGVRGVFFP